MYTLWIVMTSNHDVFEIYLHRWPLPIHTIRSRKTTGKNPELVYVNVYRSKCPWQNPDFAYFASYRIATMKRMKT